MKYYIAIRAAILLLISMAWASARAQLPQMYLNGDFGNDYAEGTMTLSESDSCSQTYLIKAKWRGHNAKRYTKKAYSLKLLDTSGEDMDAPLLGMRSDNKWILDAMAVDLARMRNRVSFDLWNDFAADSYIKRQYDERSVNGIRGQFVEVILNGSYNGVYCLTEVLDRKQLRLKKYKNNTVRGVLYKTNGWHGTTFEVTNFYKEDYDDYDNSQSTWMDWEAQYPDVDDEGETDYAPLSSAIKFVDSSDAYCFVQEVGTRFDLPVWIDYFLFVKLIYAIDNTVKNIYNYVYDITQEPKLGIAPWDLDATWGRNYDGTTLGFDVIEYRHNLEKRLRALYPDYETLVAKRYFELRKTFFEAENLKDRFRKYFKIFNDNGVDMREKERWNGVDGLALDFEAEQEYIFSWIDHRLAVLDQYYGGKYDGIRNTETGSHETSTPWYDMSGRKCEFLIIL